jgi:prepilin-type N-terminal cleavage/methylation domain-containing protein
MHKGFSLVELSIVLVILGLLTGGILAGQSLIRAAELRSVTRDLTRYYTSVWSFKSRFMGLPGDLKNATDFWQIAAGATGNDATCQNTASTDARTCNGNGDGIVNSNAVAFGERFRFWQHLANAGLIEGSYTGRDGAAVPGDSMDASFYVIGSNVPAAKLSRSFYAAAYMPATSGDVNYFDGPNGNLIQFTGLGSLPLKAEEAWGIDLKMDDGRPAYGAVTNFKSTGTYANGCTTTGVSATAEWAVSGSAKCSFTYWFR